VSLAAPDVPGLQVSVPAGAAHFCPSKPLLRLATGRRCFVYGIAAGIAERSERVSHTFVNFAFLPRRLGRQGEANSIVARGDQLTIVGKAVGDRAIDCTGDRSPRALRLNLSDRNLQGPQLDAIGWHVD